MSGGKWTVEKILQLDLKRAKNKEKRDKARKRDELRKNFDFCDDMVFRRCEQCGEEVADVYRFRVALPNLVSKINLDGGVMELCPRCVNVFASEDICVKALPELTKADLDPGRQIYDSKPRVKLF